MVPLDEADPLASTLAEPPQSPVGEPASKRRQSQWFFRIDPSPEERERFLFQLGVYLAAMYPGCPQRSRKEMLKRAQTRGHYGRLAEVAGVLVTNHVRHRHSTYETLMRGDADMAPVPRAQARETVRLGVAEVVAQWQQGSPEADADFVALRRAYRKKWQKRGRKKPHPGLTANENTAIAGFLAGWIDQTIPPWEPRPAG